MNSFDLVCMCVCVCVPIMRMANCRFVVMKHLKVSLIPGVVTVPFNAPLRHNYTHTHTHTHRFIILDTLGCDGAGFVGTTIRLHTRHSLFV